MKDNFFLCLGDIPNLRHHILWLTIISALAGLRSWPWTYDNDLLSACQIRDIGHWQHLHPAVKQ